MVRAMALAEQSLDWWTYLPSAATIPSLWTNLFLISEIRLVPASDDVNGGHTSGVPSEFSVDHRLFCPDLKVWRTMWKTSWQYLHNHRVPSCHFQTCLQKYLLGLWYERLSEVGGPLPSCRPLQKRHSCQSCTEEVRVGDLTIHPSHKDQLRWGIMLQTIEHLNTCFIFKIEAQYFYHCRVGEKSLLTKVLERIFLKQIYHCTTLSTAVQPKN